MNWKSLLTLAIFLGLAVGGGGFIGANTAPGDWYAGLTKPAFNPPPWVFGPVWTVLYVLIAVAGWRTWRRVAAGLAMQLWFAQLALNFVWSPLFFGMQKMGASLAVIVMMLVTILWFIRVSWAEDRAAAWMFVPYAAWVAFASVLNATLVYLN